MMLLAGLLLVPAYWLPLWSIRLMAPQYREGLGMFIGLRDIWGHGRHDIQNINILNHYIGMKPIDPAAVDVLAVMPVVMAVLAITALLVAAIGRRSLVAMWLGAFVVAGVAGLYEFYSWNYDYGHNLSPDAPIKVPGMTYQPPIIGSKQLLNIEASSYPSWGTFFIGLSLLAGALALLGPKRLRAAGGRVREALGGSRSAARARVAFGAATVVLALSAAACGGPADATGQPALPAEGAQAADCGDEAPAERFGGELVTSDGAALTFTSTGCLAAYLLESGLDPARIASVRVVDYGHGSRLIDATAAHYVRSPNRSSPDGLGLLAAESEKLARNLHFFFDGERLDWDAVLEQSAAGWPDEEDR